MQFDELARTPNAPEFPRAIALHYPYMYRIVS